jgi:metallo-beta-lactamase family protein
MRLTFHGAARQVTGSCYLFESDNVRFLVDCGLFQGTGSSLSRNTGEFPFAPAGIDFVILTHAHLDHSGLLPRLAALGFRGPIYTTPATRDLIAVLLPDSAHLQQVEAERAARTGRDRPASYSLEQAHAVLSQVRPVPYDFEFEPAPGLKVRLRDAGHILGSALVEMTVAAGARARRIVVSGDLGQPGRPIVRDPTFIEQADVVLLESTYGDRNHKPLEATIDELVGCLKSGLTSGVVLVPAFAVGRTQEFLYYLNSLAHEKRLGEFSVFVDSPMATEVTTITARHFELFNEAARQAAAESASHPPSMRVRYTESVQDSMALNRLESGAVILAASGMCDGGRIRHHLKHRLANPHTTVLIIGYQASGTLGRLLVDGARSVRLFGEEIPVRARIATLGGFSAHADQATLLSWLSHLRARPDQLFLVHGEPRASEALARRIQADLGWNAIIPEEGQSFGLPDSISRAVTRADQQASPSG